MPPVKVEVVLDTWRYWLNIATDHIDNAVRAHANLLAAHAENDDRAKGAALEEEFTSSMQGVSASAFSLEAFYASVNERIPADEELAKRWAKNRTARTVRICETLIRAFMITHPGRTILRENLGQVFKFRDYAVHPPGRFREPIMHPDLGVGVEWRFISFSASGAITSSRVAMRSSNSASTRLELSTKNSSSGRRISLRRLMRWLVNGKNVTGHCFN